MYVTGLFLFVIISLTVFRFAELGFLGVVILTCLTLPFFCGHFVKTLLGAKELRVTTFLCPMELYENILNLFIIVRAVNTGPLVV